MELTLEFLGGLSCIELLLWAGPFWKFHKLMAGGLLMTLSVVSGVLLSLQPSSWVVIISILSLYRAINLLRLVQGRIQADYLYHVSRRSTFWLVGLQLTVVIMAKISEQYLMNTEAWFYGLVGVQLITALMVLATVIRQIKITSAPALTNNLPDRELPSLTVALPARNETADLEACLRSLVGSNYPKLEILVLDDCSQNKHTPDIIRNFAHDGVRFIAGKPPPPHWLAKNYAYAQLTEQANSELLLFCGVDARFEPDSLSNIVKILLQKKRSMISILPNNQLADEGQLKQLKALLLQPSRYAWELALPRRLLQRPPVLSTCWIIKRQALQAAGGFAAVARKAVPESYFARESAAVDAGYSFLRSISETEITSRKSFQEQQDTAIRTRYPQLHRRPELVAVVSLAEFAVLVWPFIIALVAGSFTIWGLASLAALTCLINILWYSKIVNLTYRTFKLNGVWFLPLATLYDIGLLNYSMWQYEFNAVVWKGRNVCIPVMRVLPGLPYVASVQQQTNLSSVEVGNKNGKG